MAGGNNNRKLSLSVAFSLLLFSLFQVISMEGAVGPCSVPLENTAVYEGDTTAFIPYPTNIHRVTWTTLATTDELTQVKIVDANSIVQPSYASDFVMTSTGLAFMNATTLAEPGHALSTAGLYTAECGGSEMSFKLLVVRSGPTCSCKPASSSSVQLTCSTIYADSTYDPIAAIFTFYVDGKRVDSETPQRVNYDGYTWLSESTFTNNYKSSSTLQCTMTFDIPREVQDPSVAMNAPKFIQNCSLSADACGLRPTTAKTPKATETVPPKEATQPSGCDCMLDNTCPPADANCKRSDECQSDGTNSKDISNEMVVKAELYGRLDNCCQGKILCGVVVTLSDVSRWLIHDPVIGDNKCKMKVVNASCMSSEWSQQSQKIVTQSHVGDYVTKGDTGLVASCSDSCKAMMTLP